MKKIHFILFLLLLSILRPFAQGIPKGMNYQAVARNQQGGLLVHEKIRLKIYLFAAKNDVRVNHYIEMHDVTTNDMGLFNLIIGEGAGQEGEFGLIPWNEENIWMEVALRDKSQSNFVIISSSKLMAVPYAIHAQTADRLTAEAPQTANTLNLPGVVSLNWSVFGNALTNTSGNLYHINSMGTTDLVDLIMITDNVERLRILSGGDIVTKLNFQIDKNLNVIGDVSVQHTLNVGDSLIVKKDVLLNTIGGTTQNFGPFTVSHHSPSLLSGTLLVDKPTTLYNSLNVHGPTDFYDRLWVNNMSPSHFTGTLQVDRITNLNDDLNVNNVSPTLLTGTFVVDKSTNLNDSLTVNNMSPTFFTGTLVVNKSTRMRDTLRVNNIKPTFLSGTMTVNKNALFLKQVFLSDTVQSVSTTTGTLVVDGGMGLKKNLNIGGASVFKGPVGFASPVTITDISQSTNTTTGALIVAGGVGMGKNLNVGGTTVIAGMTSVKDTTQSNNISSGALKVAGGVGIGKNLNIGGNTTIHGMTTITNNTESNDITSGALKVTGGVGISRQLNVGGMTLIDNNTQSGDPATGALKVTGGVGIRSQLNVSGMTRLMNSQQSTSPFTGGLIVAGGVGIGLQLNVGGMTSILNLTDATNISSGALKIEGGVGILKNLNTGGALTVNGLVTLNNTLNIANSSLFVTSSNKWVAEFINNTNAHGISIEINNSAPDPNNNFMTFRNATSGVVGRIEGDNLSTLTSNGKYKLELSNLEYRVTNAGIVIAVATATGAIAIKNLVQWSSSSTGCVGFPVNCGTIPIPSMIAYAVIDLAAAVVDLTANAIALDLALNDKNRFVSYKADRVGVTYESGNGDYAEWLPKANKEETFLPGYIVGMKNGLISKKIEDGDKVMVISSAPIILGNMPAADAIINYEKVAFLGQVPVHVLGHVEPGDYILPSGNDDGLAIAVHPSKMKIKDYSKIVGVAWSTSIDPVYNIINVAIGLNGNAINKVVVDQKNKIQELKSAIDKRNSTLAKLVPGYREAAHMPEADLLSGTAIQKPIQAGSPASTPDSKGGTEAYYPKQFIALILDKTEKIVKQNGGDLDTNPFWIKLKTDPAYRDQFIEDTHGKIQIELLKQKDSFKTINE
ncbi:MAG: hypothetical protein ABI761_07700 [Saprospiraceae bacterium]